MRNVKDILNAPVENTDTAGLVPGDLVRAEITVDEKKRLVDGKIVGVQGNRIVILEIPELLQYRGVHRSAIKALPVSKARIPIDLPYEMSMKDWIKSGIVVVVVLVILKVIIIPGA